MIYGESDGHEPKPVTWDLQDAFREHDKQKPVELPIVDNLADALALHNHSLAELQSPHEQLQDNTPADDREAVARKMLNDWRALANAAERLISEHFRGEANAAAERKIVDILFLMGVD